MELALKVGVMISPPLVKAATVGDAGHDAEPASTVQLTVPAVQFSPAPGWSVTTVPGAADGPRLATVSV